MRRRTVFVIGSNYERGSSGVNLTLERIIMAMKWDSRQIKPSKSIQKTIVKAGQEREWDLKRKETIGKNLPQLST